MQETQEMQVRSLGQEDPLEEEIQPTPVLLPGKFHRQRSLTGYNLWGHKEPGMTEHTHTQTHETSAQNDSLIHQITRGKKLLFKSCVSLNILYNSIMRVNTYSRETSCYNLAKRRASGNDNRAKKSK